MPRFDARLPNPLWYGLEVRATVADVTSVFLLGLGPGLPGSLSLDAVDALGRADVVVADDTVDLAFFRARLRDGAEVRLVPATDAAAGELARAAMLKSAAQGKCVVRARPSDGWRSAAALRDALAARQAGLAVEIVPGVDADAGAWRSWLVSHPLHGRRIVVTRMRDQASETARVLVERGADPWVMPTIELRSPADPSRLDAALQQLHTYDLVAFTSANGVEQCFARLEAMGLDARRFGSCLVAAIGTATARTLRDRGVRADVIAKEFRGEELATAVLERMSGCDTKRVLIPRAAEAREILPEMLREAGCLVDVVPAYETGAPSAEQVEPLRTALGLGQVDAVLLTSSSTVKNLCELLGEGYAALLSNTVLASIGPITSETARQLGLTVGVEAQQFTIPGLVAALEARFAP